MATVRLYKDGKVWIDIPDWIDGQDKILLTIRQMALTDERVTQELIDACKMIDEIVFT